MKKNRKNDKKQKKCFENLRKYGIMYIVIALGVFLMAMGLNLFLIPNKIVTGGVSGLATILYYLTGLGTGFYVLLINFPLFWYGLKRLGKGFMLRTAVATVLFSAFLELTAQLPAVTEDGLLAALYGGLLMGAGMGLVFRWGASTGGTDLIAMGVRQKNQSFSMGTLVLAVDAAVVALSMLTFGDIALGLYAFAALAVSGKVIDYIGEGPKFARAVYIISDRQEEISRILLYRLQRGVTALSGQGLFSGSQKQILLCVISRREVVQMKKLVQQTDPNAFVIICDAKEVLGEGFQT